MSSPTPLFDNGPDLQEEIAEELRKPYSRYSGPEDITASRHGGSPTSEEANDELGPHAKARLREMVLDVLRMRGEFGGTTQEVARHLEMSDNSISGRMTELKRAGLAVETERHRKTRSGSPAAVVVAREFA